MASTTGLGGVKILGLTKKYILARTEHSFHFFPALPSFLCKSLHKAIKNRRKALWKIMQ